MPKAQKWKYCKQNCISLIAPHAITLLLASSLYVYVINEGDKYPLDLTKHYFILQIKWLYELGTSFTYVKK